MFLLLYIGERQVFDVDAICAGLAASECSAARKAPIGCAFSYDYRLRGDIATIEVSENRHTITVYRNGEAALTAAIDIHRLSDRPVRITDDAYAFDLSLGDFASAAELDTAIARAGASRAAQFQRKVAGPWEREISGGGQSFWTDGLDGQTVVEAKLLQNVETSPFIEGTRVPGFLRAAITEKTASEFARMAMIFQDEGNPLTRVTVMVNDPRLRPYLTAQLKASRLKGNVLVVAEQ